jgi:hypothetical protein
VGGEWHRGHGLEACLLATHAIRPRSRASIALAPRLVMSPNAGRCARESWLRDRGRGRGAIRDMRTSVCPMGLAWPPNPYATPDSALEREVAKVISGILGLPPTRPPRCRPRRCRHGIHEALEDRGRAGKSLRRPLDESVSCTCNRSRPLLLGRILH